MPWTTEYLPEKEMVWAVARGQIMDEDTKAQVAQIIRLLKQHEATLVLVDCSQALSSASLPGLYQLPDYATELGAPWHLRVAVVIPETRFRIETYHFLELVFKNAGYDVRLFEKKEAAEEWLQRPPPVRTGANHLATA